MATLALPSEIRAGAAALTSPIGQNILRIPPKDGNTRGAMRQQEKKIYKRTQKDR
jgi:hypothetical protein